MGRANYKDNEVKSKMKQPLLNNPDLHEYFKSQISDGITNHDSSCIHCENNIPHEFNADIMLSEVEDVLKNVKKKSPGIDRLPYAILKNIRHVIAKEFMRLL